MGQQPTESARKALFDYIATSLNIIADGFFQLPPAEQRARNERAIREMMGPPLTYTIMITAEPVSIPEET